ncbi:MAG TPA: VTT domain-containing protein [Candidatus Methylomirabilis sp.]|nr:VTT domain-containing protein [Candidatus Methylomirabilis sp.]
MENAIQFLVRHGYLVLFVWVVLEQGGLPIPAVPVLLAAGALAGAGQMHLALILGIAVLAALLSDVIWYEVGRRRGMRVLHLLCRISLEPDSCVRQTEDLFSRRGIASLLVAKFVPGLSTVAPPLAGITRMGLWRFLLFDGLGALLWVGVFAVLGLLFTEQLEGLAVLLATMGSWLLAILLGGLAAYLVWKFLARQLFLRRLRLARITPEELNQKLETGEVITIVDLRHPLEVDSDPVAIPGAIRVSAGDLEQGGLTIPRDREIILYCS